MHIFLSAYWGGLNSIAPPKTSSSPPLRLLLHRHGCPRKYQPLPNWKWECFQAMTADKWDRTTVRATMCQCKSHGIHGYTWAIFSPSHHGQIQQGRLGIPWLEYWPLSRKQPPESSLTRSSSNLSGPETAPSEPPPLPESQRRIGRSTAAHSVRCSWGRVHKSERRGGLPV